MLTIVIRHANNREREREREREKEREREMITTRSVYKSTLKRFNEDLIQNQKLGNAMATFKRRPFAKESKMLKY